MKISENLNRIIMAAYAEALSRDRWRLYKCEERLRVVNLGGTAIGTGLGGAVLDVDHLVRSIEALPEEAYGTGPNAVVMRSLVNRYLEPASAVAAVALRLDLVPGAKISVLVEPVAAADEVPLPSVEQALRTARPDRGGVAVPVLEALAARPEVLLASPVLEVDTLMRTAEGQRLPLAADFDDGLAARHLDHLDAGHRGTGRHRARRAVDHQQRLARAEAAVHRHGLCADGDRGDHEHIRALGDHIFDLGDLVRDIVVRELEVSCVAKLFEGFDHAFTVRDPAGGGLGGHGNANHLDSGGRGGSGGGFGGSRGLGGRGGRGFGGSRGAAGAQQNRKHNQQ